MRILKESDRTTSKPWDTLQYLKSRPVLFDMIGTSRILILSSWNVAGVTEELNFFFLSLKIEGKVCGYMGSTSEPCGASYMNLHMC